MPKEEPGVYDMLCRADSIGVFQVESRAQVGTLPRLQPRRFYDLVVEIALIRPGPIQGGAVHPYIRRATGREEVTYLHPALEPVLERTKGVPLFQEQLMQIAMAVGGCTGDDADLLRRAMGSKRGVEKIERLKDKLYAGMETNGITGRAGRRHLQPDPGVRQLRVRREPRDQLRPAGLRLLLAQAALSGSVPGRPAAGPADGVLLSAVAGGRCASAWGSGAASRHRCSPASMPTSS